MTTDYKFNFLLANSMGDELTISVKTDIDQLTARASALGVEPSQYCINQVQSLASTGIVQNSAGHSFSAYNGYSITKTVENDIVTTEQATAVRMARAR